MAAVGHLKLSKGTEALSPGLSSPSEELPQKPEN
jgi:hypothetical protein